MGYVVCKQNDTIYPCFCSGRGTVPVLKFQGYQNFRLSGAGGIGIHGKRIVLQLRTLLNRPASGTICPTGRNGCIVHRFATDHHSSQYVRTQGCGGGNRRIHHNNGGIPGRNNFTHPGANKSRVIGIAIGKC